MSVAPPRSPSRRAFLKFGGATAAAVALVDVASTRTSGAATTGCSAGGCTTTTVWMLDPNWGYPRGPNGKTHLVSRASRLAAANRVARTQPDALDMNLHKCSYAPAIGVAVCQSRVDAAFATWAADWTSPWNASTVSVLDLRRVPADQDPFSCPASLPIARSTPPAVGQPGSVVAAVKPLTVGSGPFAFTGSDRRLLLLGAGALTAGTMLRVLGAKRLTPAPEIDGTPDG